MSQRSIDFSTVLASSVHDMKNSLCLLLQSIEVLSDKLKVNNIEEADELSQIHYEASRLNSNLLQMLALYRAEKDILAINQDEHYLDELVEELLAKNQFYAEKKTLNISSNIVQDISWYFDHDLILNLLNDIYVNALRYGKKHIEINIHEVDGWLQVQICDDGEGYPEHMLLSSNLEPLDVSLSESRTGLGIYFAQLIARCHENEGKHGKIKLENNPDSQGSIFTLLLP